MKVKGGDRYKEIAFYCNASKIGTSNRKRKIQPMHAKDDFFFSISLSPFLSFFGIV